MSDIQGSADAGNPTATATTPATTSYDWKASLGDAYDKHAPLLQSKGWDKKNPEAVLTGYNELEKLVGPNKVTIPGKDAKPEDWRKFYSAAGIPENADGYGLKAPEGFQGYDPEFAKWYANTAHELGIPTALTQALHDKWVKLSQDNYGARAIAAEDEEKKLDQELRTEWGADYDKKSKLAETAAKTLAQEAGFDLDTSNKLGEVLLGKGLMKFFAHLGEKMGTDTLIGKGTDTFTGGPEWAKGELARVKADPDFTKALLDRNHPGHAEADRRHKDLNNRAYPNGA